MSPIQIARRLSEISPRAKMLIMLGGDAVFLPLCMIAAVSLRLGSVEDALRTDADMQLMLALLTIPVLGVAGLYRTVVRYIDLRVLLVSGVALAVAVLLVYTLATLMQFLELPRSSVLIYWFVAFAYVVTSRFVARSLLRRGIRSGGRTRVRTAIYGAGEAGAQLAYSMAFSSEYRALCFLDDRRDLQNKTVAGLKVYSPDLLAEVVFRHEIDQIVVAIPSASSAQKRRLIRRVEGAGLPVKILPGLVEMVDGKAGVSDIREVDVADLLGRDAVPPDPTLFARNIAGKVVLVTGAGGSIGSELCRQVLSQHPSRIVLLDHSEFALYTIDHELQHAARGTEIVACLGSVLDEALVRHLMKAHGVQTVYHAAAYKHVPIVEGNMQQGLRNNVFGTLNMARAAAEAGVETCVLISTDKAVRPTNVMGASKRVAELVMQAAALRAGGRTVFSMVRFGNVLGSSGSVVPLFRRQIRAGGPITITHPDIIRYFMLIPEAAQLVIQAGAMAKGGDVFVLDMGEPVRIADLARSMVRLSGLSERTVDNPGGDIEIQSVGLRPGEKLFEELLIGDDVAPSGHPRIMTAHERHIDPALLDKMLQSLRQACEANDSESMLRQIRNLVPEYRSADEVNAEAAAGLATRA
ncbi:nucleoside-diphosphate sugar epimerase/dehydratase [Piscinibacter sp.]|uniref:polysaccharide biosynthesis protein n=1 Tax=Piscinibacter sp. TaxID=1903157 RepID=UPI001E0710AC|nr:nucleoside-diphosphate sugar epimerase/dehydratase [Piscinibacter sp.]MBK7529593.1 polysaccharide biosynthesis protein [Piscinibacter sp.]